MKSIRFPFWRRRKHQVDAVKRGSQGLCAGQPAAQMSGCNYLVAGAGAASGNNRSRNQLNHYYPAFNGMCGGNVEIDKRRCGISDDLDRLSSLGGVNNISGHRSILIYINENGQAYDLSGQKWSQS